MQHKMNIIMYSVAVFVIIQIAKLYIKMITKRKDQKDALAKLKILRRELLSRKSQQEFDDEFNYIASEMSDER